MRVLLIDVNCKYSSTGKIVYDLFQNLKKAGHEAAICYGRGDLVEEPGIYKFGLDWETKYHAAMARVSGLNGCFSFFSTQRLIRFIDEFKPDIVHIHELHAYFVNIKSLIDYIKKKSIKVVWTFHCEFMYTGKCGYAFDCEKWKHECGKCPAVREYPASLFFDWTRKMFLQKRKMMQNLDVQIVTPSAWLAARTAESFLGNKPIYVIHNGIDTQTVFYPRTVEETRSLREKYNIPEKKIVLSVAPCIMDERKGGKTVLLLAGRMIDLFFVLVGADEDVRYSSNIQMIKRTKDQHELAMWYSMADLFLICSKKENFPTTCLEALACGTPIVGIDEGGTKETAPAPYGEFVKNDNQSLEGAIRHQLSCQHNAAEVAALSDSLYSKATMYNSYYAVYMKILHP